MARMLLSIDVNDKGSARVQAFQAVVRRTGQSTKTAEAAMKNLNNSISSIATTFKSIAAAVGGSLIAQKAIEASDAYTQLNARISLVTKSEAEHDAVLASLYATSQSSRTSMATTSETYLRIAQASESLGISQSKAMTAVDTLNKAITISGANSEEASAGLIQLSQAIASNRLGGDELRSVMEQLPGVSRIIAQHMGVSIGKMREMASQGKITANVVMDALVGASDEINQKFSSMPATFSQTWTQIKNTMFMGWGKLSEDMGLSKAFSDLWTQFSNDMQDSAANVKYLKDALLPVIENLKQIASLAEKAGTGLLKLATDNPEITKALVSAVNPAANAVLNAPKIDANAIQANSQLAVSSFWTGLQKAAVNTAGYGATSSPLAMNMAFKTQENALQEISNQGKKTYDEIGSALSNATVKLTEHTKKVIEMRDTHLKAYSDIVNGISSIFSGNAFSGLSQILSSFKGIGSEAETAAGKVKSFYNSMLSFSVGSIQTGLDAIKGKLEDAQAFAQSQGEMNEKLKKLTSDVTINGQKYSPMTDMAAMQQEYAAKGNVLFWQQKQVQAEYMLEQVKSAFSGKDTDKSKLNEFASKNRTLQSQIDNLSVMQGLDTKAIQQQDALKGMNAELAQTEAALAQINAQSQAMSQLNDLRKELTAPVTVGGDTYSPMSAIEASRQEYGLKAKTLALQNEQLSKQMTIAQAKQGAERDESEITRLIGEQNALMTESAYLGKFQQLSEAVEKQKEMVAIKEAEQQASVSALQAQQSLSEKLSSSRISAMPSKTYDDVFAKNAAEMSQLREKLEMEKQLLQLNFQITQEKIQQETGKGDAANQATLLSLKAEQSQFEKEINTFEEYRANTIQAKEIANHDALLEKADALTKYVRSLNEGMEDFSRATATVAATIAESLVSGFGTFMNDLVSGTKSAKEALLEFAQSVSSAFVKSVSEMVAKKALLSLASATGFPGLEDASGMAQGAAITGNTTATTANTAAIESLNASISSTAYSNMDQYMTGGVDTRKAQETPVTAQSTSMFSGVWDSIKSGISTLGSWISSGFTSLFSGLGSMLSSGLSGIWSMLSGVGGGIGSMASGGMSAIMSILPMLMLENGGAISGGRMTAFAAGGAFTNSIVSSPTFFPMANGGTGLMGEAGPEAVMPLTRTSGGKLGVRANVQVQQGATSKNNGRDEFRAAAHQAGVTVANELGAYFKSRDGQRMLRKVMDGGDE